MTSEVVHANVAILGAGPAGAAAAAHLGTLGVRNVMLVDKHDFPRDKTCGSGVSPRGIATLKELGVWHEVEPHAYWIKGIRLVTPDGHDTVQSAGDVAAAIVCQRRVLDHVLVKKAVSRGAKLLPDFHVVEALSEGERTVGIRAADGREVRAKLVMIAGGSHCRVGLPEVRPRKIIQAIMGWWDDVPFRANHVEMIFDRALVPYYGWLFPEGERRVNVGITYEEKEGDKRNARTLFKEFLDRHYAERLAGATQVGPWKGHPITWSYGIESLTAPGRIVIGEAGLMTHPATAEGIYQGMRSGMLGAEAIADVLVHGRSEADAFAQYERRCREQFQLSFWGGGVFRRIVRHGGLDRMVALGETPLVQSATARLMAQL